jgi:two-component system, OmpR family, phosphate regulon sensor histidine kinase PhoR
MNPKVVFWVPVGIRLGFLLAGAGLMWWWFGLAAGIVTAFAGVLAAVFIQLKYLYQLSEWLDKPESGRLPDGWGEWTNIFSRLYRLRRDDEKNQAELTEWLARFRQAMHLLPDGVVIMDDVLFLEWCNPAAEEHLGLQQARDKGMRVTNLVRSPDFMDYLILGRYDQPLTLNFRGRKLVVHIIK